MSMIPRSVGSARHAHSKGAQPVGQYLLVSHRPAAVSRLMRKVGRDLVHGQPRIFHYGPGHLSSTTPDVEHGQHTPCGQPSDFAY